MAQYAIVVGTKVVKAPVSLVTNYNGVGGFHKLTDEKRKEYGWYPCSVINEGYNSIFQNRFGTPPVFDPETETVTLEYIVQDRPVEQVKFDLINDINNNADQALKQLSAGYPERETISWSVQEREARSWLADNLALTPLVDAIAAARGVPKNILVDKIIEKADLFALASGTILGMRQAKEAQVEASSTIEDLKLIDTSVSLPEPNPEPEV